MKLLDKLLIISGLIGPLVFLLVLIFLGSIYPGYNHITQHISELGADASPVALEMNIFGFIFLGTFVSLFSIGLYRTLGKTSQGKIGAILVLIAGLSLMSIAFFPCDIRCENISIKGIFHDILSTISILSFIVASFLLADLFRKNRKICYLLILLSILTIASSFFWFFDTTYPGLTQRITISIPLLTMSIASLYILRKSGKLIKK